MALAWSPNPYTFSAVVLLGFLLTYTAWDKTEKKLRLTNVLDVVLARRGVAHTLVELNKILALAGLVVLPASYFLHNTYEHVELTLWTQTVHAIYSTYKYYGDKIPYLTHFPTVFAELGDTKSKKKRLQGVKKISIVFGILSLALLTLQIYVPTYAVTIVSVAILTTGLIHFITMEVDFKLNLQVRTTGNWTIPLTIVSIISLCIWGAPTPL